ncbi:unnamed protein product [Effrenium voratum]|nr:unnamed protein product [Effrenium voratum]
MGTPDKASAKKLRSAGRVNVNVLRVCKLDVKEQAASPKAWKRRSFPQKAFHFAQRSSSAFSGSDSESMPVQESLLDSLPEPVPPRSPSRSKDPGHCKDPSKWDLVKQAAEAADESGLEAVIVQRSLRKHIIRSLAAPEARDLYRLLRESSWTPEPTRETPCERYWAEGMSALADFPHDQREEQQAKLWQEVPRAPSAPRAPSRAKEIRRPVTYKRPATVCGRPDHKQLELVEVDDLGGAMWSVLA